MSMLRQIVCRVFVVGLLPCLIPALSEVSATQVLTKPVDSADPKKTESSQDIDPATRESIGKFFELLQTKFDFTDANSGAEYLDLPEMESVIRQNTKVNQSTESGAPFVDALKTHWPTSMESWQQEFYWDRHRINKIEKLDERRFAVSIRHFQEADDVFLKLRWTIVRQDDESWKFSNIEDSDQGVAVTSLLAILIAPNDNQADWVLPTKLWLLNVQGKSFFDEDMNPNLETLEALDQILDLQPPADIQAFLLTLKISLWMVSEDAGQTDVDLHNFQQLPGEHPIVYYFKGGVLMSEGDFSGAIDNYERYAELTGWDPDVCESVADSYLELGEINKAIEFSLKGLEDDAEAFGCLATLAIALPDDRKSELNTWFEKNNFDEDILAGVIDWALTNDDQAAASYAFGILKARHPRSPVVKELQMLIDR